MRLLCLHGAGTNSRVFELQTAALRHELGEEHTYDFVEGVVPCPMFPGIESISFPQDKYFAYYTVGSEASMRMAQHDLASYIAAEGPFDGVLAFSQGSALVARFLQGQGQGSQHHGRHSASPLPPFRCAIFLSGHPPDHDTSNGSVTIMIPTVHIWGTNDELDPKHPEQLSNLCKSDCRSVFVHEGGHEVPNSRNPDALTHAVRVIRRVLVAISV